jgi:hypothetical protein
VFISLSCVNTVFNTVIEDDTDMPVNEWRRSEFRSFSETESRVYRIR